MTDWRKFPEVHHPPRGPNVKLFDYNDVWLCTQCDTDSHTASEIDLKSVDCPTCGSEMTRVRDNAEIESESQGQGDL